MADEVDQSSGSGTDSTALSDIATNGALLNQNLSELINAVGDLGSITLPVVNGGTGLDHVGTGDILYGSAPDVYSLLPDVATGSALISGGISVAPSWGKINLATTVTGSLPPANGGTGRNTLTAHAVLLGEGTSQINFASPSTAGQPLLSNGASNDPSFQSWADGIGGLISYPSNQDYKIWLNSPFSGTIASTTTICTSGTCTATFKINGVAVGGSANAVSASKQTVTRSSANTFASGDDILITVSSNSSCVGMSFMISITRP